MCIRDSTTRGSKHLLTLIDAIKKGYKSYLIFLVQIQNMEYFKIAKDIDSKYYEKLLQKYMYEECIVIDNNDFYIPRNYHNQGTAPIHDL